MKLGPWGESLFHRLPPDEFRAGSIQFDEKKCDADACPEHHQITPSVISEQLKRVNGGKDQRDPLRHDPQQQFDARINRGERNENSKMYRSRTDKPDCCQRPQIVSSAGGVSSKIT